MTVKMNVDESSPALLSLKNVTQSAGTSQSDESMVREIYRILTEATGTLRGDEETSAFLSELAFLLGKLCESPQQTIVQQLAWQILDPLLEIVESTSRLDDGTAILRCVCGAISAKEAYMIVMESLPRIDVRKQSGRLLLAALSHSRTAFLAPTFKVLLDQRSRGDKSSAEEDTDDEEDRFEEDCERITRDKIERIRTLLDFLRNLLQEWQHESSQQPGGGLCKEDRIVMVAYLLHLLQDPSLRSASDDHSSEGNDRSCLCKDTLKLVNDIVDTILLCQVPYMHITGTFYRRQTHGAIKGILWYASSSTLDPQAGSDSDSDEEEAETEHADRVREPEFLHAQCHSYMYKELEGVGCCERGEWQPALRFADNKNVLPWPERGVAYFAAHLFRRQTRVSYLPSLISSTKCINLALPILTTLIADNFMSQRQRGIALAESVLTAVDPDSLTDVRTVETFEETDGSATVGDVLGGLLKLDFFGLIDNLISLLVYAPDDERRSRILNLLRMLFSRMEPQKRFLLRYRFIRDSEYDNVVATLLDETRRDVGNLFASNAAAAYHSGLLGSLMLPKIIEQVFTLRTINLVDAADVYISGLNLYKLILLLDKDNATGTLDVDSVTMNRDNLKKLKRRIDEKIEDEVKAARANSHLDKPSYSGPAIPAAFKESHKASFRSDLANLNLFSFAVAGVVDVMDEVLKDHS